MFLKKSISSLAALTVFLSSSSVLANGVLPEDKEVICDAVEILAEERPYGGYCQFFYSSPAGEPLLKEGIKYALELNKYVLAEKLMKVFGKLGIDINEVEGLDYFVVRTGRKDLYDKLVESGYKISTPENCPAEYNLLHAAVESENPEFVELFLKEGFDPNALYYCGDTYPLSSCLFRIMGLSENDNGYGFEYAYNRERAEKIIEIVELLCNYGADPFLLAGKGEDESAFTLLGQLDPKNENNCYGKLEFYSKTALRFCEKISEKLNSIINQASIKGSQSSISDEEFDELFKFDFDNPISFDDCPDFYDLKREDI